MSNPFGVIYKATNLINGKCYIGQTTQKINVRISRHKTDIKHNRYKNNYFHNAVKKYGWDFFQWDILCECSSREELDNNEIYFIKYYNSFWKNNCGYNLTFGGYGHSGYIQSDEQKKNNSERLLKLGDLHFTKRLDVREKISKSNKGKPKSESHIKSMSECRMGKNTKHSNEKRIIAIELRKSGKKCKEISEIIQIPLGAVSYWCKSLVTNKHRTYTKDKIKKSLLFRKKGLSCGKISKIMNIPETTIQGWCRKLL